MLNYKDVLFLLTISWTQLLPGQEKVIIEGYEFQFEDKVAYNPVEDQGRTGTCWSFSTSSFLESEIVREGGKSIDLSEMFFVRNTYVDKAEQYLRYHGKNNFSDGSLSHDVLRMLNKQGAMPEEVYTGLPDGQIRHNHTKLLRELRDYVEQTVQSRIIHENWKDGFNAILDQHLGPVPEEFSYNGQLYDPQSFARTFVPLHKDDYITLTSFTHHPYDTWFVLEIPDNYAHESYYNIQLEMLNSVVDHALSEGYTAVWDCDVSESGFLRQKGLAIVPEVMEGAMPIVVGKPQDELPVDAEMRQKEFDSYSLTDDHLMHIVGKARDQTGTPYYYVKNSWGSNSGKDGFLFTSRSYYLLNTIAITLHKDALPPELQVHISESSHR